MTEIYAVLSPTNDLVRYTSLTPSLDYIDSNIESLFGPINAPKLYAQELDALELASSGKVAFTLSNNHSLDLLTDNNDVVFRARDSLSLKFITESSNVSIELDELNDDLNIFAGSNFTAQVGQDLDFDVARDISIAASNNYVLTTVTGSMTLTSGDDYTLVASNNVNFTATTSNLNITTGDSIVGTAQKSIVLTATDSNINLTAGNDILQEAVSNVEVDAGISIVMTAGTSIIQNAPEWQLNTTDIALVAANNVTITASNAMDINIVNDDLTIDGGKDIIVTATSNISHTATNNDLTFFAGTNTTFTTVNSFTSTVGNTATISASNAVTLQSTQETVLVSADGDLTLQSATDGDVYIKAPNDKKTLVQIGGANILEIYRTEFYDTDLGSNLTDYKFKINADLEVLGTTNSISVNESTLNVEDKVVHLAFNSNLEFPYDGTTNDGAGLMIDGMPQSGNSNVYERYEKSFKWYHSSLGVPALGSSNITDESYWNLRGGGLRITQVDDLNGNEVAFGFRINHLEELEIYKMTTPNGGSTTTARVAKLGRTIS